MEFKGTKGKWTVANYGHCIAIETKLDNGQEHTIFTDQFCHASKFDGDAKANALLISKAPEMLECLQSLENDNNAIPKFMWDRIQSLIKSATQL